MSSEGEPQLATRLNPPTSPGENRGRAPTCYTNCLESSPGTPGRDTVIHAMKPYLRILFIMVMSFIVVILGTVAVAEASVPLVEQDAIWLLLFALMVVATILAARLFGR
jgi:hypothetical protein